MFKCDKDKIHIQFAHDADIKVLYVGGMSAHPFDNVCCRSGFTHFFPTFVCIDGTCAGLQPGIGTLVSLGATNAVNNAHIRFHRRD